MYRQQILDAIRDSVTAIGITHVQLWNEDIQFLTEGQPFPTPAIFIEFLPVQWQTNKESIIYANDAQIRLHCITHITEHPMRFQLATPLRKAIRTLQGDNFDRLLPFEDNTCHNHSELIEDTYSFTLRLCLSAR